MRGQRREGRGDDGGGEGRAASVGGVYAGARDDERAAECRGAGAEGAADERRGGRE